MARFFHMLRTSFVTIATVALILPSISPTFADERPSRNGFRHCHTMYEDCRARDYRNHSDNNNPWHLKHKKRHKAPQPTKRHTKDDTGKWVVAGIIGLAAGAIILSEVNKSKHRNTNKDTLIGRVQPQPIHDGHGADFWPNTQSQPYTQTQNRPRIQPWTNAWYRWCAERYRSFNPRTGTYRGLDGFDHFCVVE